MSAPAPTTAPPPDAAAGAKPPGIESIKAANALVAQFMTVSTALLAFSVTFVDKFRASAADPITAPWSLKVAWLCWCASILFGFLTYMATTGTLDQIDSGKPETNPKRLNIRIPAGVMIVSFGLGLAFMVVSGWTITA